MDTKNKATLWEAWEVHKGPECLFCLRVFGTVLGRKRHEVTCKELKATRERWEREASKMRLTEEDVFAKGSQPAVQHSSNMKRYLRKEGERFHRKILRQESAVKAKRAVRHGWNPKNDMRKTGEHQP